MKAGICGIAAATALFLALPAAAQVQYDTTQLDQRADVERNRILLNSTVRKKQRAAAIRDSVAQKQACASRTRFRREYKLDNPKLKRLETLCKQAGY